jgi:hypothetical protein
MRAHVSACRACSMGAHGQSRIHLPLTGAPQQHYATPGQQHTHAQQHPYAQQARASPAPYASSLQQQHGQQHAQQHAQQHGQVRAPHAHQPYASPPPHSTPQHYASPQQPQQGVVTTIASLAEHAPKSKPLAIAVLAAADPTGSLPLGTPVICLLGIAPFLPHLLPGSRGSDHEKGVPCALGCACSLIGPQDASARRRHPPACGSRWLPLVAVWPVPHRAAVVNQRSTPHQLRYHAATTAGHETTVE